MKKPRTIYMAAIFLLFIVLIVVQHYSRKPIDWRMSFDYRAKAPYGCVVMKDMFRPLFGDSIVYNTESVYNNPLIENAERRSLIIITGNFTPDKTEKEALRLLSAK